MQRYREFIRSNKLAPTIMTLLTVLVPMTVILPFILIVLIYLGVQQHLYTITFAFIFLAIAICVIGLAGISLAAWAINKNEQKALTARELQLKKLVYRLERSNEELERFAYIASHDLQEPLRMISGFTELIARKYKDKLDAEGNELIEFAVDGAKRMQQLITDLLAYSRVGTKGKRMVNSSMQNIVEEAIRNLSVAIQESGAQISYEPLPTLQVDNVQILQLFQNLISNAIKFHNNKPPEVHIRCQRSSNGEWIFSVSDKGIGISPEFHEQIFQIFQRLHTRSEYPGTGVGLAICKKIVERHGGRMWVESKAGQGAKFCFTLPA